MKIENGSSKPTILFTWLGWNHGALNLDRIPQFSKLFTDHLERSSGRKILVLEAAGSTFGNVESLNDEVKEYGGLSNQTLAHILTKRNHRKPDIRDISKLRDMLERTPVEQVIDKELLPYGKIAAFYLDREIDRLRDKYGFEVDYEAHPGPVVREIEILHRIADKHIALAGLMWADGKFDLSLQNVQKAEEAQHQQANSVREHSFINKLKRDLRKLKKEGAGSIFTAFGSAHCLTAPVLQKELGSFVLAEINVYDLDQQSLRTDVSVLAKRGEVIPDLLLARQTIMLRMSSVAMLHLGRRKSLSILATNYGLFNNAVESVAKGLSLVEIKEICETKIDLLGIIQNHPIFLGNPILRSIL